jgi:SAM-dependent methyltransferase
MSGIRLGEQLLLVGPGVSDYFATLATKVGLSGRTRAMAGNEGAARQLAIGAARAGALVEIEEGLLYPFPFDDHSFDVIVADGDALGRLNPEGRVETLKEAYRTLRPAGRILVVQRAARGGLGALLSTRSMDRAYVESGGAAAALTAEGFRPVRTIAEREGLEFIEGFKGRT